MVFRAPPLLNFGTEMQPRSESSLPDYDDVTVVKRWYHYAPLGGTLTNRKHLWAFALIYKHGYQIF